MKQLIAVRHGESVWNKENRLTGWEDIDLTADGRCQAYEAGLRIARAGLRPEYCFTSRLKRAVKSLNAMLDAMNLDYLPVAKSWRLNEKSNGALQGCSRSQLTLEYGEQQALRWRRGWDCRPPALEAARAESLRSDLRYADIPDDELPLTESLRDLADRLMPYLHGTILPTLDRYDTVLIVAHGNTLRALFKEMLRLTPSEAEALTIPPAQPYIITLDESGEATEARPVDKPPYHSTAGFSNASMGTVLSIKPMRVSEA